MNGFIFIDPDCTQPSQWDPAIRLITIYVYVRCLSRVMRGGHVHCSLINHPKSLLLKATVKMVDIDGLFNYSYPGRD